MALMTLVNVTKAAISLGLSIVVARTVAPGEYGLVALAVTLLGLLTLLTDLGLASAVVRQPRLEPRQAGAATTMLLAAAAASALVLLVAAEPLQSWLDMHGLAAVLRGFAVVAAASIAAVVPRALLERRLAYNAVAGVELGALAIATVAFGVAVQAGAGILALVAFHAAMQITRMTAFMALARTEVRFAVAVDGLRELIDVGGSVFVSNLLAFSARNVDRMLIAAVLGSSSLGLYAFAYQFMTLPLVLVTWPASGVLLAALSRLPDDDGARADLLCAVIALTAMVTFPLAGFMLFGLDLPIASMFGDRWSGAGTLVAILAPAGAVQSLAAYGGAVLISRKDLRLNFGLSLFSGLTISACFASSVWFGIRTLAIAYSVTAVAVSGVFLYWMCRRSGIGFARFIRALLPGAGAAIAGVALVAATLGTTPATGARWLGAAALYAIVCGLAAWQARRRLSDAFGAIQGVSANLLRRRDAQRKTIDAEASTEACRA